MITVWRVYLEGGSEFGIDYPTLERAREVKSQYASNFPHCRYYIRAVHLERSLALEVRR